MVLVGRERDGRRARTPVTSHYYVTSRRGTAAELGRLVRRHWAVENELHWCLDVAFREDASPHLGRSRRGQPGAGAAGGRVPHQTGLGPRQCQSQAADGRLGRRRPAQAAARISTRFRCVSPATSSDAKASRLRQLGAAHTINYKILPGWGRIVMDKTGGRGVDHVVEVGGAGTLPQSLSAVRVGGHIAIIGAMTGRSGEIPLATLLVKQVRLQGIGSGPGSGL